MQYDLGRMSESDLDLLAAWKAGDKAAGERLFERHFEAVMRFVASKTSYNVEDLVQQAFLACVEGRHRLRDGASFRSYLFAAARNVVVDRWRAKAEVPIDLNEASAHDLGPSPSSALRHRRQEQLLVQALRRIPLNLQIAIELYYVEGLKSREVADVLDIPHGTVRTRLRRALTLLREAVAKLQVEPGEELTTTMGRLDAWAKSLQPDPSED